jgi:hypothetical protein
MRGCPPNSKMTGRDLERESRGRRKRHAPGHGIRTSEVQIRAPIVRFASVEDGDLPFPSLVVDAGGDEAKRDVCGIEPMVADRCDRIVHRREAMRESRWPERGLAGEGRIELPADRLHQRPVVLRGQLHEEIVRMLTIVDGVPFANLSRRQHVERAASWQRPRLETEHRSEAERSLSSASPRHRHTPVAALELMCAESAGPVNVSRLIDELTKQIAVEHDLPIAPRAMDSVCERVVGLPRRA